MGEYFTLVDFWCWPILDSKVGLRILMVGIASALLASLFALYIKPNRTGEAIKIIVIVLLCISIAVIAVVASLTSFKCEVVLADESRKFEHVVITHRYPETGMSVVIIPVENDLPLMNKLHSSSEESR